MAVRNPVLPQIVVSDAQGAARRPAPDRRSSERRGNVIALQSREARLRVAARAAGFGIYDLDCLSGDVRWSPELKIIADLPSAYIPTSFEQIAEIAHADDRERLLEKLRASLDPKGNGEFEDDFRLLRPGGSLRWVKVQGWTFFVGEGNERHPIGAMGIIVDRAVAAATQLYRSAQSRLFGRPGEKLPPELDAAKLMHELQVHQIELEMQNEELRQTQSEAAAALRRYTELYDFAPVGYFTIGGDGTIHQLNLAAASLLGGMRGDLIGKRFGTFVEEGDRTAFNAYLARVLAGTVWLGRVSVRCEIILANPDNPSQRRVAQVEARRDESGTAIDAVAVDITEKKEANDELIRSNLELQQFAYVAAHDLQTPLRSISGFVHLLQQEYGAGHGQQADAWVGQVVKHVQRMQALIQDLLTYSRLDSPSRPAEPTDFNELFDDVVGIMDVTIRDSGATVTRDELPTVTGNRVQLAQVLQNLIDNGIKYRGKETPKVHVSSHRQAGMWVISVRDNGIGVDAKHHQHIFEIFSRLHSQQAYPGTGIGLAICQRIIHRHGGRIWLESESGQGCAFHFSLPDRPSS
jgi:PAS domain S-box-containing protein